MEKLRRCDVMADSLYPAMSYLCHAVCRPTKTPWNCTQRSIFSPYCHVSLPRSNGLQLLGLKMDSQSRAFEAPVEEPFSGTPLRCPRPMVAQSLVPWTASRILAALFLALVSMPAQLAPVVLNRRRA